jgi:hypothetical protein
LAGKFVLRTNMALEHADVARAYKSLWRVERTFRETKSTLEVRPVFHHRDDTTVGHIVGCFLALRLEVDLQRRLDERAVDVAWPDLMRDRAEARRGAHPRRAALSPAHRVARQRLRGLCGGRRAALNL